MHNSMTRPRLNYKLLLKTAKHPVVPHDRSPLIPAISTFKLLSRRISQQSTMSTQKAIIHQEGATAKLVTDLALPRARPGFVKVAVKAVALNPTDWKSIDKLSSPGHLAGCDYAGVVEETGTGYSKQWKKGDKIAGVTHGGNRLEKEDGAFAEHIIVKADVQFRMPDSMSFEEASTLGVGVFTCGQGLFQALGLNLPTNPASGEEHILIYGGSSATGALGIQYAKLAGYTPITTCSPSNFDYVKSLGAAAAFDYKDPKSIDEIKSYTNGNLKLVWDCISLEPSLKYCAEVISTGGKYAALLPVKLPRDDVTSTFTLAYTAMGEPLSRGNFKKEDNSEDFEFATKFASITDDLLAQGKLKVHRPKVSKAGLDGVLDGLDLMRNDKVSGEKLVYAL